MIILWLRDDLRFHDHAGWQQIASQDTAVKAVYFADPANMQPDKFGLQAIGKGRHQQRVACFHELRQRCRLNRVEFELVNQSPVDWFCQQHQQITSVYTAQPQAPYECQWLQKIKDLNIDVSLYSAQSLFEQQQIDALTSPLSGSFSRFRKKVEGKLDVPKPLPSMITQAEISSSRSVQPDWPHGEVAGRQWLHHYLFEQRAVAHYKTTRNALQGRYFASHLSPYLASGALSAREVWHQVGAYEAQFGDSEHSYWLKFELLWREFFHWSLRLHGRDFFRYQGLCQQALPAPEHDQQRWQAWCMGKTGVPMIDAGIKELLESGHISNRLRQNMASYFIHQLRLDWRLGAAFFEQHLLDFDVASNYGNWAYIAGAGHDPRQGRQFNINKQLSQYDPKLTHIKQWLPQLSHCGLKDIVNHTRGQKRLVDYPAPVVAFSD